MSLTRSSSSTATSQSTDQELPSQPDRVDRLAHDLQYGSLFWCQSMLGNSAVQGLLGRDPSKRGTQDLLTDRGIFDTVGGGEAAQALSGLEAMDPKARQAALEGLSPDQLQALIASTPSGRQAELSALADATTDPDQRLQLWAAGARARATADLADPTRAATASATLAEIDDEVAHFQRMAADGKAPTLFDIDEMIARKQREGAIESSYGVNLTNAPASDGLLDWVFGDPEAGRRVWSDGEMDGLDEALKLAPAGALTQIGEIERVAGKKNDPSDTGAAVGGVLSVTDEGVRQSTRDATLGAIGDNTWQHDPAAASKVSESDFSWDYAHQLVDPAANRQKMVDGPRAAAEGAYDRYQAARGDALAEADKDPTSHDAINAQQALHLLEAAFESLRSRRDEKAARYGTVTQAIDAQSQAQPETQP